MKCQLSVQPTARRYRLSIFSLVALLLGTGALFYEPAPTAAQALNATPVPAAATATQLFLPLLSAVSEDNVAGVDSTGPTPVPMPADMMEPVAPDWVTRCSANTVPFEAQAWWMNDFGHVHLGFCAPVGQKISGSYTMKVRLVLHNNPGKLSLLQAQIDDSHYGQTDKVNVTCPITDTCAWDDAITFDTSTFPNDGWHHIRIRAVVTEPDGNQLIATNFIPVYMNNGKPVSDFRDAKLGGTTNYASGRGWYTNVNYTWSTIFNPPLAKARVKGTTTFAVRPAVTSNPKPISAFIVKLDATHTDAGTTLYNGAGTSNKSMNITLDTTKLSNGWHSLLARTEAAGQANTGCAQCSKLPQTHAGVIKIWFYVQN